MKQFIRYTILCVGYILGSQSLLYAETPTDSIDTIPTDSIIAKKDTPTGPASFRACSRRPVESDSAWFRRLPK